MGKSVFSGRFFHIFVQFQDIKSHEFKSEIHSDLGFSEVTEACVSVIVFQLPENRFRFQRPPFQLSLVFGKIEPFLSLPFLSDISKSAVYLSTLAFGKDALLPERAAIAMVACHHG